MKRLSRTRLFLLEMLVNLLVFCIGAAICLMALSQAYSDSAGSRVKTQAERLTQNAAMAFRSTNGDLYALPLLLHGRVEDEVFRVWYSRDGRPVSEKQGIYCLTISKTYLDHHVVQAKICVRPAQGGDPVTTLIVRQYTGSAAVRSTDTGGTP